MKYALCTLLAVCAAQAATPLFQASFDKAGNGWTVVRGAATPDGAVLRGSGKSLRVEPGTTPDAVVRSTPVSLKIGERYELTGWIRTENLTVRDLDRSPISIGAALSMASMPFDVHSESLGGTKPWTRVSLKFVASRAQDQILLTVGNGGAFQGKAWFEGVSLDAASWKDVWPAKEAIRMYGPAYRYPAAGWTYLHIEGKPYERGYQHGQLMSREIPEYLERCAADLGGGADMNFWNGIRTSANALFLRGFDREILEEMRGIAEGASDAGAKWLGRRIDLVDIVAANVTVELGELRQAVNVTPTGLEHFNFDKPSYGGSAAKPNSVMDHCSAFAATGPATKDGKMVIGHVTWWPLTLAEGTNVWLDIKPEKGHRMLMQSYAGGIESGTDWYQNDAGMVLTETTIAQTPFNAQGTPVAFRARMAIQYAANIDEMVKQLGTRNNGLYTNEWLMGDAKTNEIAMYELGTNHTKLWRSSNNEWFGNTPGFYWGNNNAKDLDVRLETHPDPKGSPVYVPFTPAIRDLAWNEMYNKYKGQIDEQFAFTAFRTAPLVSASTMDAKVVTADMINNGKPFMVWAAIGKPNQREWVARGGYAKNDGLYPSGYYLFSNDEMALREAKDAPAKTETAERRPQQPRRSAFEGKLWDGWVLPASDADTWLVAGSAAYHRILQDVELDKALDAIKIQYRGLKFAPDNAATRLRIEESKGVLALDAMRRKLGDDKFLALMKEFFAVNGAKTITAQSFLDKAGVPFEFTDPGSGPMYLVSDIRARLASAIIVYGTMRDAGANRYAAEQLQSRYLDQFEHAVPIYKDFEVSDEMVRGHDVVYIGRPEANSALTWWESKRAGFKGATFSVDTALHASERDALLFATANPLDPARMALIIAGNDALRTVKAINQGGQSEFVVYEDGAAAAGGGFGRRAR